MKSDKLKFLEKDIDYWEDQYMSYPTDMTRDALRRAKQRLHDYETVPSKPIHYEKRLIEIIVPSELDEVITMETLVEMFNKGAKDTDLMVWSQDGLRIQLVTVSVEPVWGKENHGLLIKTDSVSEACTCVTDRPNNCVVHRPIKEVL